MHMHKSRTHESVVYERCSTADAVTEWMTATQTDELWHMVLVCVLQPGFEPRSQGRKGPRASALIEGIETTGLD